MTEDRTNEEIRERLAIAVPGLVHLLGSNDAGKASAQALFQLARSKTLRASIREVSFHRLVAAVRLRWLEPLSILGNQSQSCTRC